MKTAKDYTNVARQRYYPEVAGCLSCGSALRPDHAVWRKYLTTLDGTTHVTNVGCYCRNPACPHPHQVYRSAVADSLSLRGFSYGLDVIAWVGQLRWGQQRTRTEIYQILRERGIAICEREVQHLYDTYAVLVQQSLPERIGERRDQLLAQGGLLIALDGIQPEKGNACLWVVREGLTGTVLVARTLEVSDTAAIRALLAPVNDLGLPILGVVSDGYKPIRLAVAGLWPTVHHQVCQFHFLRDIALPTTTADRQLKTELKQELRGIADVERRPRDPAEATTPVIRGYTQALRAVLLEDGEPPLALPGLAIYERLEAIEDSLAHCQEKKGIPT
jgi:hypothetical protein